MKSVYKKLSSKWRVLLIILAPAIMLYTLIMMLSPSPAHTTKGRADLSDTDFSRNQLVALDGQWEFYWDKLRMAGDFDPGQSEMIDSFMTVPGVWSDADGMHDSHQGTATYRLTLYYPSSLRDPALRIQNVATAYKLYANGQLMAEVGKVSDNKADFQEGEETLIIDLPKDSQEITLIFQMANLRYASGGLRVAPVFGSKQVLEQQRRIMLVLQLLFIGGVFIFGLYYFLLFLLQNKNRTALLFCILCLVTVLRSLIWGGTPLMIFFPDTSFDLRMYINYLTGYNYLPIVILFVQSIYPLEYKKSITGFFLLPTLVFDGLLLITGPAFMSSFTNYIYIILLVQMIYVMSLLMKSVLRKRDNAILMFITTCVFIWTINEDILNYKVIGNINTTYMFLFGNFAVILAMSYIQARQQAMNHKKLILYKKFT